MDTKSQHLHGSQVNWKDTLGQKFNLKPDAEMASTLSFNKTFIKKRNVGVKGGSKLKSKRTQLQHVEYDRQFLVEYIAYHLSGVFEGLELKDAQKLFYEARRHHKEQGSK